MDLALVEAARSGDEEAFASIARGSADRLFAVAHRILRDVGRAEDAVQQTLVTAWRDLPALRDIERFEAWIHRDPGPHLLRRGETRLEVVGQRRGPAPGRARRPATLTIETRDSLDRGFRRLPAEQRAVFVLHHYLGWSVGEIAENLGVRPKRSGRGSATRLPPSGRHSMPMPGRPASLPGSGWHERERIRSNRPSLARGRPDPNVRPRRAVRPRGDPHDSTAPCLVAGAEGNTCEHLCASGHCRGPRGRRRPRGHQRPSAPIGRIGRRRPAQRKPVSVGHSRAATDLRLIDQRLLDPVSDDATIQPATVVSKPFVQQDNNGFDFIINEPVHVFRGASTLVPDGVVDR